MALNRFTIDDWRGGESKLNPEKIGSQEASTLVNFLHTERGLSSFPGKTKYNSTEILTGKPIRALTRFYMAGVGKTITVSNTAGNSEVWLNTGTDAVPAWKPIQIRGLWDGNATFQEVAGNLYSLFDSGASDETVWRWTGDYYATGTITTTGSDTTVTGSGTAFTANVRQGDMIYFYDGSTWYVLPNKIVRVNSNTILTVDENPAAYSAKAYIIVRSHPTNVTQGVTPTLTAVGSGGSLSAGAYYYKISYYNDDTGFETNAGTTSAVVTCVASDSVTVTIPAIPETYALRGNWAYNKLRIYRTNAGGSVYYYLTELTRSTTTHLFAASYTDTTADSGRSTTTAPTQNTAPPQGLRYIRAFNDRLYGFNTTNKAYFSSLGDAEYFPLYAMQSTSPITMDNPETAGGFVAVGQPGEKLTAMEAEGGSYQLQGRTGASVLFFNRTSCYRWSGWDWTEFALDFAFNDGCVGPLAVTAKDGYVYYISPVNGPTALQGGTNNPIPIWQTLFPADTRPFTSVAANASLDKCVVKGWRNYILFCYPATGDTTNTRCAVLHVPTGTWMEIGSDGATTELNCSDLVVWDGPGDSGQLMMGDATAGYIWQLFNYSTNTYWTGTTGVASQYISPIFYGLEGHANQDKHLRRIEITCHEPTANQTVTCKVYSDGDTGTATFTGTATASASSTSRQTLSFYPGIHARGFQVEISGTFTVPVTFESIRGEYSCHGRARTG